MAQSAALLTCILLVSLVHPVLGLLGKQQAAHYRLTLPPTISYVLAYPSFRFSSVIDNPTLFTLFFPSSFSLSLITFVTFSHTFPIFLIRQSLPHTAGNCKTTG